MDNLILTPETALALNKAYDNLLRCVLGLQKITAELTPEATVENSLQQELKEYCRELQRNTRISIRFTCTGMNETGLQGIRSGIIYRMAQHLLFAAIKSDSPEKISLDLRASGSGLELEMRIKSGNPNLFRPEISGRKYWQELLDLANSIGASLAQESNPQSGNGIILNIPGNA